MAIELYELVGTDDRRFSPFCWRTRMALAHKGLDVVAIPCKFTEKAKFAFSDQERVPVIRDGANTVHDSWRIAEYLEDSYPDQPSLFGGAIGRAEAKFFNVYTDREIHLALVNLVILDIHDHCDPVDRTYFRTTREKRFGRRLEDIQAKRTEAKPQFDRVMAPLAVVVAEQPFFCGDRPAYADYIVFGAFQFARGISPFALLDADNPLAAWRGRMMDLFGGLARSTTAYPG